MKPTSFAMALTLALAIFGLEQAEAGDLRAPDQNTAPAAGGSPDGMRGVASSASGNPDGLRSSQPPGVASSASGNPDGLRSSQTPGVASSAAGNPDG